MLGFIEILSEEFGYRCDKDNRTEKINWCFLGPHVFIVYQCYGCLMLWDAESMTVLKLHNSRRFSNGTVEEIPEQSLSHT